MSPDPEKPSLALENGVLTVTGPLRSSTVGHAERTLARMKAEDITVIDGSGVTDMDSSGAVFINRIAGKGAELRGFGEGALKLLELSRLEETGPEEVPEKPPPLTLERLGGLAYGKIDRMNDIAVLVVDILFWGLVGVFRRDQYRRGSFTEQSIQMGSTALPIVATILFLIGAISALQSAETLKGFGASIFVVDMLALGLSRELAPLMTAIIISGRSGSAIASEVATMKFTEELDAIKTMGLNPLRFVVVPKLWAMVVCMPLLTIMALFFGLLGGFLVATTYMQISPNTFLNRILISLFFWDICTGLIKSFSFAIIITIVGTYRGLTFSGGADGVGRATTSSVVTSIFAIIIMDSIWGIVFYL